MGNPVYYDEENAKYKQILERGLLNGNFFVEKIILEKNKPSIYCVFSSVNYYDYIFWQEDLSGNITLPLKIDRRSSNLQYTTGSLTRIGKMMCDSAIKDITLIDYLNTLSV